MGPIGFAGATVVASIGNCFSTTVVGIFVSGRPVVGFDVLVVVLDVVVGGTVVVVG